MSLVDFCLFMYIHYVFLPFDFDGLIWDLIVSVPYCQTFYTLVIFTVNHSYLF